MLRVFLMVWVLVINRLLSTSCHAGPGFLYIIPDHRGRNNLKDKDLVIDLADGLRSRVTDLSKVFLHGSYHGGRTADKDSAVGGTGVRKILLDVFLSDVANATFPSGRGVVEDVKDLEPGFVDVEELIEVVFEEYVLFVDVGVNEGDGGAVVKIPEGSANDLDHGCDTRTASNQVEVGSHANLVTEVALGALDPDTVADLEERYVF